MTTDTVKLYKALLTAGVDEETAQTVSEGVTGRDETLAVLTARVNVILALNTAMFAGILVLVLDKIFS